MSKKVINQKTNYNFELLNSIDSNFVFSEKPINRLRNDYSSNKLEYNEYNRVIKSISDMKRTNH